MTWLIELRIQFNLNLHVFLQKAGHFIDSIASYNEAALQEEDVIADQFKEYDYLPSSIILFKRVKISLYRKFVLKFILAGIYFMPRLWTLYVSITLDCYSKLTNWKRQSPWKLKKKKKFNKVE